MRYLPIHVDMKDAKVLVIGGGAAAEAKLRTLLKTKAAIRVVAPSIGDEIVRWSEKGLLTWVKRDFRRSDLNSVRLIYAATEDDTVTDQKEACDFITPALVARSPVVVSIGTEGTSPSLARAIKTDMESRLPSLGAAAIILGGYFRWQGFSQSASRIRKRPYRTCKQKTRGS